MQTAKYKNKWAKDHVERIYLIVPIGMKDEVKAHATSMGESVNSFVTRAIKETMKNDTEGRQ